ncbi:MAG: hypothetical protein JNL08_17795 [Planctomycetes bacterium]|nr:hypothetical protein [Planctomycetota bacterium]
MHEHEVGDAISIDIAGTAGHSSREREGVLLLVQDRTIQAGDNLERVCESRGWPPDELQEIPLMVPIVVQEGTDPEELGCRRSCRRNLPSQLLGRQANGANQHQGEVAQVHLNTTHSATDGVPVFVMSHSM